MSSARALRTRGRAERRGEVRSRASARALRARGRAAGDIVRGVAREDAEPPEGATQPGGAPPAGGVPGSWVEAGPPGGVPPLEVGGEPRPGAGVRLGRRGALAALLVFLASLALFSYRLSVPRAIVFDEVYYVKDSCETLTRGSPGGFVVHPPLGKWLIAAGMWFLGPGRPVSCESKEVLASGVNPVAWRASSAVAGALTVSLVFVLARELFSGSTGYGLLAGALAATDPLLFVQSRIAMLDIFLSLFLTLGFLFLWRARAALLPSEEPWAKARGRLALAGAAFGLGLATKWSALPAQAVAGWLLVLWGWKARREAGLKWREALTGGLWDVLLALLFLVLLPLAIYLASYAGWFAREGLRPGAWLSYQREILHYHLTLKATHPYQSRAWTWPFMLRPVAYYWEGNSGGGGAEILGMGNPLTWWTATALLPLAIYLWARGGRPRLGFLLAALASLYLPWLLVARPLFLFYMTPAVPLIDSYLVYLSWSLGRKHPKGGALAGAVLGAVSLASFVFFYPVLAAVPLSARAWRIRMWLRSWI